MSVVVFHAFPALLPGGFVGVDIFFVISGYLISSILLGQLHGNSFSLRAFYARRIKRIFPAVVLMLAACYAFGWFNLTDTEYQELGRHIAAGAIFISNLALWREAGYFDVSAATKPLLHLWSLGVEEQFYIFWPLILWSFHKTRIHPLSAIAAAGMASFALNLATVSTNPTADFYSPLTRAWELMLGCGLAYRYVSGHRSPARHADLSGWAGVVLISAALVLLRGQDRFPGWEALLPTVGAYCLIAGGPNSWISRHLLKARPLVGIGLISFPLYLWHWPLLVFCRILAGKTPAWPVQSAVVLLSFALAWLTFKFVEQPIRCGKPRKWTVAVLVLLMAAIGLQGFNTYRRAGLAFRLTHMVGQFASVQHDVSLSWREHVCFLGGQDNTSMFDASCTDQGSAPLVFLWGDSHAAALYPGLRHLQQQYTFRIAEYAAATCPPLLGIDAPNARCAAIHQDVLQRLQAAHPSRVILTADWQSSDARKLSGTVAALRSAGVTDIAIVGPVPFWHDPLPKIYWMYWRKYHRVLPVRTHFDLLPETAEVDRQMQAAAEKLQVRYLSAYRALCNRDGCETRTGPGRGQVLMFDAAHLTPSGSIALMQAIAPDLFGSTMEPKAGSRDRPS